jgi:hypothetical protein
VDPELAQQLGAKRVDGSTLYTLSARPQLALEPRGNLARRFVGERENADALRIQSALLDEEPNPLDQAERLSRARTGENQDRLRKRLNGLALGVGRDVWRLGCESRRYRDDRVRSGEGGDGSGQV